MERSGSFHIPRDGDELKKPAERLEGGGNGGWSRVLGGVPNPEGCSVPQGPRRAPGLPVGISAESSPLPRGLEDSPEFPTQVSLQRGQALPSEPLRSPDTLGQVSRAGKTQITNGASKINKF